MNTGTQPRARPHMVDLDSNPTKLIEVSRSAAAADDPGRADHVFDRNDVAKYFAIIPAMFLAFYRSSPCSTSCIWRARKARSCRRSSSTR